MNAEVEQLRVENAYLKEQVEELTGVAAVPAICARLGLSHQQARMLLVLTRRANMLTTKAAVYRAVFEHENGDGPADKIMDIVLCRVRQVLRKMEAPGRIETVWGHGWKATPELTAWVRAIVNPAQDVAA